MSLPPLLCVTGLTAHYGEAQAVFGADLTVEAGQVVAMLGRNGAGKTTTIRTICRLMSKTTGAIIFDGHDLSQLAPHRVAQLGIGLVPEGRRCFAPLTVWENAIAAARPPRPGQRQTMTWDWGAVTNLFPRLAERRDQTAATLSGGEQQMLAIARALMTNPRLLILDEATEGLAPTIRQEIWAAARALKASGQAIILVDKNLTELLPVTDLCVIFDRGQTVWYGPPSALTADIRDRYLGI